MSASLFLQWRFRIGEAQDHCEYSLSSAALTLDRKFCRIHVRGELIDDCNETCGLLLTAVLVPSLALAAAAKKYQVTGKVLELTDAVVTVEKGDEKWEIARDAQTKVQGDLKVGAKVTIEYRMTATAVEVKAEKAKPAAGK